MNKERLFAPYLILYFLLPAVFASCSDGTPQISVMDAQLVPSQLIGRASSFMKIVNNGTGSDSLTECMIKEHPSVRGEIHDAVDGRMVKIGKISIPAGRNTDLKKGGLHLMFFGLPEKISSEVTVVLTFEKSGRIEVPVPVSMMGGHEMNH